MRVFVVCNSGMSSSILVKKMKDYAASQGEEQMILFFPVHQRPFFLSEAFLPETVLSKTF